MARSRRGRRGGLDWNGAAIRAKVKQATIHAINETLADAVTHAKNNHPGWKNVTANAEGSIRITQTAASEGARIVGRWGSEGVVYMRALEFLHGSALRGAADVTYRGLQPRIKRRLK